MSGYFRKSLTKSPLTGGILVIVLFVGLLLGLIISVQADTIQFSIPNGLHGIIKLPKGYKWYRSYPLIITLHGMGETAAYTIQKWAQVADQLNTIVIAPQGSNFVQGYIRTPTDDRKLIVELKKWAIRRYRIKKKEIILAGFSRGGNFAIETGLLYPHHFPKILSIFGFFVRGLDKVVTQYHPQNLYQDSHFHFITGRGDLTEPSLTQGHQLLKSLNIQSELNVLANVIHRYPDNLVNIIRQL